jgi:hypothetical protein
MAALPALSVDLVGSAGLALPVVAVVFAAFLGIPLARADWEQTDGESLERVDVLARALADVALVGSVAVGLASWAPAGFGALFAFAVWVLAALARLASAQLALFSLAGWALIVVSSSAVALEAPPWSLLEPSSELWTSWLSAALGMGALVSWGAGQWSTAAAPHPGRGNLPATAAGLGVLAMLAGCVGLGAGYEGTLAARTPALVSWVFGVAGGLGAFAVLLRAPRARVQAGVALAGLVATLWFVGPARSAHWAWWSTQLPLLLGTVAGLHAFRRRDVRAGLAAVLLVGAVLISFPGVPERILPAAAAAVPIVVAIWFAGTRALLEPMRART